MSNYQPIFKRSDVERLREEITAGTTLNNYLQPVQDYPVETVIESTIEVPDTVPELSPEVSDDIHNAIKVFEYLGNIDKTQASDKRLWAYLSHVTFREYTMDRWGIKTPWEQLSVDGSAQKRAITYILEHWFAGGNDRSMRRHAIARLWWAANLTVAPWESEPEYFGSLENEDRFVYTRALFSYQDIYQQTLERGLGRSNHILIAILEYLRQNPDFAKDRPAMRGMMKELNLTLAYRQIEPLTFEQLFSVVRDAAETAAVPA